MRCEDGRSCDRPSTGYRPGNTQPSAHGSSMTSPTWRSQLNSAARTPRPAFASRVAFTPSMNDSREPPVPSSELEQIGRTSARRNRTPASGPSIAPCPDALHWGRRSCRKLGRNCRCRRDWTSWRHRQNLRHRQHQGPREALPEVVRVGSNPAMMDPSAFDLTRIHRALTIELDVTLTSGDHERDRLPVIDLAVLRPALKR